MHSKTLILCISVLIPLLCNQLSSVQCHEESLESLEESTPANYGEESVNYEQIQRPEDDQKDPKKMQIVYIKVQGRAVNDDDHMNPVNPIGRRSSTEPEMGNSLGEENLQNQYSSNREQDPHVSVDFSSGNSESSSNDEQQYQQQNHQQNQQPQQSPSNSETSDTSVNSPNTLSSPLPRRHIYQPEIHGHFTGPLMGVEEGHTRLKNKPHMNLGILPIIIQIDDNGKMPDISHAQVLQQANSYLGRAPKLNNFVQRNATKHQQNSQQNSPNSAPFFMPPAPFTPGYMDSMSMKPFGMPADLNQLNNQFWKNLIQTANNQPSIPLNNPGNSGNSGSSGKSNSFWNNLWPSSSGKTNNNGNGKTNNNNNNNNNGLPAFPIYDQSSPPFINQYGSVFDWFDAGQNSKMIQQALAASNTNLNYEPLPTMVALPTLPLLPPPSSMVPMTASASSPSSSVSGAPNMLFRNSLPTRHKLRNSALVKSAKSLFSSFSSKGNGGNGANNNVVHLHHHHHPHHHPHHHNGNHHKQQQQVHANNGPNNGNNNNNNNANGLLYSVGNNNNNAFAVHNGASLPVLESNLFASIATSPSPVPLPPLSSIPVASSSSSQQPNLCRRPIRTPCVSSSIVSPVRKTPTLQSALALLSPNSIVHRKAFTESLGQRLE